MKVIYNSRVLSVNDLSLSFNNRSFCYGDALFETIVTGPDEINLVNEHLDRLSRGCQVMGLNFPQPFNKKYIEQQINGLADTNGLSGRIRTKLTLWREAGGKYAPVSAESSFLIEVQQQNLPFFRAGGEMGVSKHYRNHFSPISFAKTTNALHYVLAGKEMDEQDWDDIILLDQNGHLSETHTSNLFWSKEDKIFTPKLSSGCIEGILRKHLINTWEAQGQPIIEVLTIPSVLKEADTLFTTNASGIRFFTSFEGRAYHSPEHLLQPLLKQLPGL